MPRVKQKLPHMKNVCLEQNLSAAPFVTCYHLINLQPANACAAPASCLVCSSGEECWGLPHPHAIQIKQSLDTAFVIGRSNMNTLQVPPVGMILQVDMSSANGNVSASADAANSAPNDAFREQSVPNHLPEQCSQLAGAGAGCSCGSTCCTPGTI